MSQTKRRYPIGAEFIGEDQTHFRVWAPKAREVDVVFEGAAESKPKFCSLTAESGGYFSGQRTQVLALATVFALIGRRMFIPIRRRVFNPMGHTERRAS